MKLAYITLTLFFVVARPLAAADTAAGESLHQQYCVDCHLVSHDKDFYIRPGRKMHSLEALHSQIRYCDANLGTRLFDEEMEAIADYLNQAYYRFEVEKSDGVIIK